MHCLHCGTVGHLIVGIFLAPFFGEALGGWTNSCAMERIDYTTNKSGSETKATGSWGASWSGASGQEPLTCCEI